MFVVRPIEDKDFDALFNIAKETGHGFTSLPVNETLLKNKIAITQESFASTDINPNHANYLMVLENTATGEVVGTCGIEAAVGINDAFYHYRLGTEVYYSEQIKVRNEIKTLTLCHDYTGATELCTLFLRPDFRVQNNGKLLSRSRLLLLAEHKERFNDTVIAEMRGVCDENNKSPFYHWLQEHFLGIEFSQADYLSGVGKKSFMGEMMPRHPIYVSFLPKKAQQVIGKVHQNTQPALNLLKSEGFRCRGYVDIFDGGPTLECSLQDIRSVKESKRYQVSIEKELSSTPQEKRTCIVSNTQLKDFRSLIGKLSFDEVNNRVMVTREDARALLVNDSDWLRVLPL